MKKLVVLMVLGATLLSIPVYAGIETVRMESKAAAEIEALIIEVERQIGTLINYRDAIDIYSSSLNISVDDKDKMPSLKKAIDVTITNLNAIKSYISAQWENL